MNRTRLAAFLAAAPLALVLGMGAAGTASAETVSETCPSGVPVPAPDCKITVSVNENNERVRFSGYVDAA